MLNIKGVYGYTEVSTSAVGAAAAVAADEDEDEDLINVDVCCANAAPPTVIPNIHTTNCLFIL
jgi:hypothetical protein